MYIIDFDDTLFDTHAFKQARLEAVVDLGVSEDVFWETYKQARNNQAGEFTYSDGAHAMALAQQGVSEQDAYAALESVSSRMADFLFPDAHNFLQEIKATGEPVVLLSLGDPNFQEQKVQGAGIHEYFDRVFMVKKSKVAVVGELLAHHTPEETVLVNDKVAESEEIQAAFPDVTVLLKQSKSIAQAAYDHTSLPVFASLTDIISYVRK